MPVGFKQIESANIWPDLASGGGVAFRRFYPLVTKGGLAILDQALFAGTNFIVNILLARCLSPVEYGAFAIAFSVFLLFGTFHTAILTEPMMVFGPGKYAAHFEEYLRILVRGHFLLMLPGALMLVGAALLLGRVYSASVERAFFGLALAAPFILLLWLLRRAFYARLQPGWAAAGGTLYLALVLGLMSTLWAGVRLSPATAFLAMGGGAFTVSVFLLVCFQPRRKAVGAVFSLVLLMGSICFLWSTNRPLSIITSLGMGVLAFVVIVVVLLYISPSEAAAGVNLSARMVFSDHWRYGRWSVATAGISWLPINVYYALLPYWFGLEIVGAFRALMNLAMPVWHSIGALTGVLLPVLVQKRKQSGSHGMAKTMKSFLALFVAGCTLYLILLWGLRSQLFQLLYGGKYKEYTFLPVLLVALLPFGSSVVLVFGSALRALERPDWVFWCYVGSAVSTLLVGIPLVAAFGITGALGGQLLSILAIGFLMLLFYKSSFRREPVLQGLFQSPFKLFQATGSWIRNELAQSGAKPIAPIIIALLGPDGVGKSTAIECVRRLIRLELPFTDVIVRHWRPGLLPPLARIAGRPATFVEGSVQPRRDPGKFRILRLAYYFLDFLLGSWWKDHRASAVPRIVIYDRWALDMAVDPVRYGLSSARGIEVLSNLISRPDLIVLLYDTAERIYERKPELEKAEIERQLTTWAELTEKGELDAAIRVDAGPEEIALRIKDLVLEAFVRRNGEDLAAHGERQHALDALGSLLVSDTRKGQFRIHSHKPEAIDGDRNWTELAVFGMVPSASSPRLLTPLSSRKAAAAGVQLYNPQKPLTQLGKRLLSTGLRAGLAQPFLHDRVSLRVHKDVPPERWKDLCLHEHLRELLGVSGVAISISWGTPSLHQKPVVQVMTPEGDILGYVKIGWNPQTMQLLRSEEVTLRNLKNVGFSTAAVPAVIHAGGWNDLYLLVLEAPRGRRRVSRPDFTEDHLEFLLQLQGFQSRRVTWNESSQEIQRRVESLQLSGFTFYAHLLQLALANCDNRFGKEGIPLGFRHGDFAPWNVLQAGGKLFVVDWEYAQELSPPGWDLFHFLIKTAVLVRGESAKQIYGTVLRPGRRHSLVESYFQRLGVSPDCIQPLLVHYLADILSWHLCRDGQKLDTTETFRRTLGNLLTLVLRLPQEYC